jgi:hypothetical protein
MTSGLSLIIFPLEIGLFAMISILRWSGGVLLIILSIQGLLLLYRLLALFIRSAA